MNYRKDVILPRDLGWADIKKHCQSIGWCSKLFCWLSVPGYMTVVWDISGIFTWPTVKRDFLNVTAQQKLWRQILFCKTKKKKKVWQLEKNVHSKTDTGWIVDRATWDWNNRKTDLLWDAVKSFNYRKVLDVLPYSLMCCKFSAIISSFQLIAFSIFKVRWETILE